MKPKRSYIDYVRDMLEAAEKAQRFAAGMDYATFTSDDKTNFLL